MLILNEQKTFSGAEEERVGKQFNFWNPTKRVQARKQLSNWKASQTFDGLNKAS